MKFFKERNVLNACENACKGKCITPVFVLLGHLSGSVLLHPCTFSSIWGHGERCFANERMTITRDNSAEKTDV